MFMDVTVGHDGFHVEHNYAVKSWNNMPLLGKMLKLDCFKITNGLQVPVLCTVLFVFM